MMDAKTRCQHVKKMAETHISIDRPWLSALDVSTYDSLDLVSCGFALVRGTWANLPKPPELISHLFARMVEFEETIQALIREMVN